MNGRGQGRDGERGKARATSSRQQGIYKEMKENKPNIGFVHEHCAADRHKKFQKENSAIKLGKGNCVKLGFPVNRDDPDGEKEWMWVEVDFANNKEGKAGGQLLSTAVRAPINPGTTVLFDYYEIVEIAEKRED